MNCNPGDLAIIVKSWAGNEGKIVRCMHLSDCRATIGPNGVTRNSAIWVVDQLIVSYDGSADYLVADSQLRPLKGAEPDEDTNINVELENSESLSA